MLILLTMPRSGGAALAKLLGLPAGGCAGEVLRALKEGVLAGDAAVLRPGVRATCFGHAGWEDAVECWSWLLREFPECRVVFLTRAEDAGYEMSLEITHELWRGRYGKCAGSILRRTRVHRQAMADFAEMNPSRCVLVDHQDLADHARLAAVLGDLAPGEALWAEVAAERPGNRAAWKTARRKPEPQEEWVEEDWREKDWAADPFAGGVEWNADPFARAPLEEAPRPKNRPLPPGHQPRKPRPFIEFPAWHARAIVYPWLAKAERWDELRHSLRSIERHWQDKECPIYILGEAAPPWLVPGGRVRWLAMQGYAKSREEGMWQAVVTGTQLAEKVLWMNDDIYLLQDLGWEDMGEALTEGRLEHLAGTLLESPNVWKRWMAQAVGDLQARQPGRRVWRFATHTPYLFEREKSVEILKTYHLTYKGGWVNLYHNHHGTPRRACGGWKTRKLPAPPEARYYNHADGGPGRSAGELAMRFPEPAPWEDVPEISAVWLALGGHLPHAEEFRRHNPDVPTYVDDLPRAADQAGVTAAWRSGDRRILEWWRRHRDEVKTPRVAFLEWDVRVTRDLRRAIAGGGTVLCADIHRPGGTWGWLHEIPRLPEPLRKHALGVAPLSVLVFAREALDAILAHPQTEEAMARDIFCELRLGTLANAAGHRPRILGALHDVQAVECANKGGISHPVKT